MNYIICNLRGNAYAHLYLIYNSKESDSMKKVIIKEYFKNNNLNVLQIYP